MIHTTNLKRVSPFFIFLLICLTPVYSEGLLDNLGMHLSFDEGSGLYAEYFNGSEVAINNFSVFPTAANGTLWDASGIIGSAVKGNGSAYTLNTTATDFIRCAGNTDCGDNQTLSFWIKPQNYVSINQPIYYNAHTSGGMRVYYNAGFINTCLYTNGTCFKTNTPILANEWSHFVVTVENGIYRAYINGQETTVTDISSIPAVGTSNTVLRLMATIAGSDFLNASIDEMAYWYDRSLDTGEIISLYNNGDGLPFSSYSLIVPSLLQSIPDVSLNSTQNRIFFLNNYFSNYRTVLLSFFDEEIGQSVSLSVDNQNIEEESYNTTYVRVKLTSFGSIFDNDVRIIIYSNQSSFDTTVTVVAQNDLGFAIDSFELDILGESTVQFPIQIAGFKTPFIQGYNQSYTWTMSDNFVNFDGIRLNFIDDVSLAPVEIQTEVTQGYVSYANTRYNISLTPILNNSIRMTVTSNDTDSDIVMEISAFYRITNNSFRTISDDLTVNIRRFGGVFTSPPVKIKDIGTVVLSTGESFSFNIFDIIEDYTSSSVSFIDMSTLEEEFIIYGESYEQGNFTIENVGDKITITALATTNYTQDFILIGTNQAGSVNVPFTVSIGSVNIGQGTTSAKGILRSLASGFSNLFPDSSTLSFGYRMAFVFVVVVLTVLLMVLIGATMGFEAIVPMVKYVSPILIVIEIFFFIGIGYIPIVVVIIAVVLAIISAFLMFGRGSG